MKRYLIALAAALGVSLSIQIVGDFLFNYAYRASVAHFAGWCSCWTFITIYFKLLR